MVVGALVGGAASSVLVGVGCGGDDTSTTPQDGGGDGTMVGPDAPNEDGTVPDAGDSGPSPMEAMAVIDAPGDAPADAPVDAQADAPTDADAGDASALLAFPSQVAQAVCSRFASCCFLGGDASTFDMTACLSSYDGFGYAGSSAGANQLNTGHVAFDATQAASCLSQIAAIDCTANLRTSAQEKAIRTACYAAMTGTVPVGGTCVASIECAPGLYCTGAAGGAGFCQPLRVSGQSCGDFGVNNTNASENICSYRGSGNTGLTCHNGDYVTGVTFADAGDWLCQPQQALNAGCNANVDCTTALCDPGANFDVYVCKNAEAFIYPFACQSFIKADGG
jgi:hypothetical protein